MKIKNDWLDGAKQKTSPFYNSRPEKVEIDLVVIHSISLPPGEFGGPYIDQLFTGTLDVKEHDYFKTLVGLRVAPHVLIDRQGELAQYVSFAERAWHAGTSSFQEKEDCNDFSIGIELEGADGAPFALAQYEALATLLQTLMDRYPKITLDRIVGHSAVSPGRKKDPGILFDWQQLHELIKGKRNEKD